jgi:hypothetical protein
MNEELNYTMGVASDMANAYSVSCMNRPVGDYYEIQKHLADDKFLLVADVTNYCEYTDALIGSSRHILFVGNNREEVQKHWETLNPEDYIDAEVFILPREKPEYIPPVSNNDEIPF